MNESITERFIMRFKDKPSPHFITGVQETFDSIETNMLRVGVIQLLPMLRQRRNWCLEHMYSKQFNQDYLLGCIAVLDHCLKEH